jgi:hypothetical protein
MNRARALLSRLKSSVSGVAAVEFALSMPFLLFFGLWGIETANYAIVNMRVSQLAFHLADNASRIGDTSELENRKIYEADIEDLLRGADIQSGRLDLFENGRAIISSVERYDETTNCVAGSGCPAGLSEDDQFIHWQRCKGEKNIAPVYGTLNAALPAGIGPVGREVSAPDDSAVIFVEVHYDYQPLVSDRFINNTTIRAIAAFIVRDSRDLTGIKQRNPGSPDPVSACNVYDSFAPAT